MRTAEQNYLMNPEYKTLVDFMERAITDHQYSPSEMREAAMLACVRYEMKRPARPLINPEDFYHPQPKGGEDGTL